MTAYLSTELGGSANQTAAPVGYKPRATVYCGRLKRIRGTFTANTQTSSDTLLVGRLPAGATFAFGVITASATMGAAATLAIGTAASTEKYRAAATFEVADTPTFFGNAAAVGAADPALTAPEEVIVTIGTDSLPASGTLVVDLFYSMP